ncbi:MAG: metal-dependent hydrolase [Chloroflexi bacterium]|nr:metal-dependent hydrolase [Chloroflexota bacterium]
MAVDITWLGHAGFVLDIDDYRVLIDPFITDNPLAPVALEDLDADFILLSHGHGDHVRDTPALARRTGAEVVSNVEICGWLRQQHGIEVTHGINTGGGVELAFGRVELTMAFHSSSLPDGSYGGQPNGLLIQTYSGQTIYHAGDTAPFMEMQWIGEAGIDLAMLPIGDYFTMGIEGSLRAIRLLQPRTVIPMHYNTFDLIVQDASRWAQRVNNETDAKPIVLDPGGSYRL